LFYYIEANLSHYLRLITLGNNQRHAAEHAGYFVQKTSFLTEAGAELKNNSQGELTFYDSVTGQPLFYAPRNRTFAEFVLESKQHGWPSFRDAEVNWDVVRCIRSGEAVSLDGTHLGHNIPDRRGNRYCINLVSIAGRPAAEVSSDVVETVDEQR
jgi:peptide methionine sulfoxide reductase MsrB